MLVSPHPSAEEISRRERFHEVMGIVSPSVVVFALYDSDIGHTTLLEHRSRQATAFLSDRDLDQFPMPDESWKRRSYNVCYPSLPSQRGTQELFTTQCPSSWYPRRREVSECWDYRHLNRPTVKDQYQLLRIAENLRDLHNTH